MSQAAFDFANPTADPAKMGLNAGTYELVFDGGSLGNPGKGYGSFEITRDGEVIEHLRLEYGDGVTNNQAEYRTLIGALTWLADELGDQAKGSSILIHGDSKLVLFQLMGKWKVKHEGLRPLHQQGLLAIRRFKSARLVWQPRAESVKRLGH